MDSLQAAQRSVRFLACGCSYSSNTLYKATAGRKMTERHFPGYVLLSQLYQSLCASSLVCGWGSEIHLLQLCHSLCARLLHKSSITSQCWHLSSALTEPSRSDFSPIPSPGAWFPLDFPLDSMAFHCSQNSPTPVRAACC